MVDTDTCIAVIKGHAGAIKKLRGKSIGQVGISAITLSELNFGAALAEFTLALEVAAFDAELAPVYGSVRASLAKRGRPIGPLDTLIGSHALALDITLVTHNTREFSRIDGLRLEDWIGS
jgi:tRNA(fMet)-specific endonuclease VapC